jgi:hypothetical protein
MKAEVPEILKIVTRVVEIDLAPPLIVFFITIGLGQFYIFAAVIGYFIMLIAGLLVLAYKLNNVPMIRTFRIIMVVATICGFFNIFIDNMIFDDANPDGLMVFAFPNSVSVTTNDSPVGP